VGICRGDITSGLLFCENWLGPVAHDVRSLSDDTHARSYHLRFRQGGPFAS